MSHPHAELRRQADEWWPNYRWRERDLPAGINWSPWFDSNTAECVFAAECEYEIEQTLPALYQKRVQIPEPLRKAPEMGSCYYYANPRSSVCFGSNTWIGDMFDSLMLERGLAFATADDAAARGRAMLETER